ncbi:Hypothetical predicted protein [Paramuricea clavata]|uniref:Uncharacterized protein n=1 Tax=Paramuricea clavata TaxID=317549 RepID=A0A7D9IJN6_PARCT|nr:Hypothetical predicted protein [Paramuricea clavata]
MASGPTQGLIYEVLLLLSGITQRNQINLDDVVGLWCRDSLMSLALVHTSFMAEL